MCYQSLHCPLSAHKIYTQLYWRRITYTPTIIPQAQYTDHSIHVPQNSSHLTPTNRALLWMNRHQNSIEQPFVVYWWGCAWIMLSFVHWSYQNTSNPSPLLVNSPSLKVTWNHNVFCFKILIGNILTLTCFLFSGVKQNVIILLSISSHNMFQHQP